MRVSCHRTRPRWQAALALDRSSFAAVLFGIQDTIYSISVTAWHVCVTSLADEGALILVLEIAREAIDANADSGEGRFTQLLG